MSSSATVNSLVGSATRYIAGRNAVQTVYWRTKDVEGTKMFKYNKTCSFEKSNKLPYSFQTPIDIKFKS